VSDKLSLIGRISLQDWFKQEYHLQVGLFLFQWVSALVREKKFILRVRNTVRTLCDTEMKDELCNSEQAQVF
jgi:hypothetical protein